MKKTINFIIRYTEEKYGVGYIIKINEDDVGYCYIDLFRKKIIINFYNFILKILDIKKNDFKSYKEKFKEFGVHSFKETGKIEIKKIVDVNIYPVEDNYYELTLNDIFTGHCQICSVTNKVILNFNGWVLDMLDIDYFDFNSYKTRFKEFGIDL